MKYYTDSRKVESGGVFVAIKGHTVDGHDYITDAINNGASKVVAEHHVDIPVELEVVKSTEEYLKHALKEEYGNKLNKLRIIGITGTNGKTTTAYLTYQLLNMLGENTAYIGTIGYKCKTEEFELNNTTPDILTIYELLSKSIENGCKTIVMEVSSHALSYERLYGLHIDIAAFTNLTEDHLDYHKTMENYLNEKLKIINYLPENGTLIVNSDDPASGKFLKNFNNNVTLGYKKNNTYYIKDTSITPSNTDISFIYENKEYNVRTNLTSKFNVYNYITALALVHACGYEIDNIIDKTDMVVPPRGRCETVKVGSAYAVIDYAHTPDAVEKVITAYTELKKARIITIVGCGGDRDPLKRPIMGDIATRLSDYTILTSDNPRTENPESIMEDILKGVKSNNYEVILDRKEAIHKGLDMLEKDDILLILGKGHEDYQIIGHTKYHLSDLEEVQNYIREILM